MNEVAVTAAIPTIQNHLASLKGFLRNKSGVAPLVQLTFVGQHAGVIAVPENLRERAGRHRTRWLVPRASTGQAHVAQEVGQLPYRVPVGCVLLEREPNERSSFFVKADRVDETPVELLPIIDVSELGAPDRPAVDRLVAHLLSDVLPALTDLDFVHDVGDGFHGVGHVALAEILLR
nr:hypothetical protein [Microbacterium proteolyticum]